VARGIVQLVLPESLGKQTLTSHKKYNRLSGSHKDATPRKALRGGVFFKPLLHFRQLLADQCPGLLKDLGKLTFE
jgi:hypothetical protein